MSTYLCNTAVGRRCLPTPRITVTVTTPCRWLLLVQVTHFLLCWEKRQGLDRQIPLLIKGCTTRTLQWHLLWGYFFSLIPKNQPFASPPFPHPEKCLMNSYTGMNSTVPSVTTFVHIRLAGSASLLPFSVSVDWQTTGLERSLWTDVSSRTNNIAYIDLFHHNCYPDWGMHRSNSF